MHGNDVKLSTKMVKFEDLGAGVQALDRVNMAILWKSTMYEIFPFSYKYKKTKTNGYDV